MRDYLAPLVGETEDGTEALLPEEQTILARRWRFSGEGWLEPAEGGPLPEGGAEAPRPEAGQGDPPAAGPGAGQENVLAGLLAGAVQEDRLPPLPRGQGGGRTVPPPGADCPGRPVAGRRGNCGHSSPALPCAWGEGDGLDRPGPGGGAGRPAV